MAGRNCETRGDGERFVLDYFVAAAWLFEDEAAPETYALLDQLANGTALVPLHWRLELGNVLVHAERRCRVTPAQVGWPCCGATGRYGA